MASSPEPTDHDASDFYDNGEELECTHCGGEGLCWDGSDPLGNCPDDPHRCHACHGSGKRKDQVIF
jgi:hypothetical protein